MFSRRTCRDDCLFHAVNPSLTWLARTSGECQPFTCSKNNTQLSPSPLLPFDMGRYIIIFASYTIKIHACWSIGRTLWFLGALHVGSGGRA